MVIDDIQLRTWLMAYKLGFNYSCCATKNKILTFKKILLFTNNIRLKK